MSDRVRIRHQGQQDRFSRLGCIFLVYPLVGEEKLAVSGLLKGQLIDMTVASHRSSWVLILGMSGVIVLFWFVGGSIALRYFVLFIGVMSCMYVVWDVIGQIYFLSIEF